MPCRQQVGEARSDFDAGGRGAGNLALELEQLVLKYLGLGLRDVDQCEERRRSPHVRSRAVLSVRDEGLLVVAVRPDEL